MTFSRPYLVRAIYDWLLDNNQTPYIMVDALAEGVSIPRQYVKDGKIILNIAPGAIAGLALGNQALEFKARFSGVPHHIYVPMQAVQAVYSYENGRGMVFNDDDEIDAGGSTGSDDDPTTPPPTTEKSSKAGKPHLRVVK